MVHMLIRYYTIIYCNQHETQRSLMVVDVKRKSIGTTDTDTIRWAILLDRCNQTLALAQLVWAIWPAYGKLSVLMKEVGRAYGEQGCA